MYILCPFTNISEWNKNWKSKRQNRKNSDFKVSNAAYSYKHIKRDKKDSYRTHGRDDNAKHNLPPNFPVIRFRHNLSSVKQNSKASYHFELQPLPFFFHANALIFSFTQVHFVFHVLLQVCICSVTHLMNRFCSLCRRFDLSRTRTERNLIGWNFVQEVRLEKRARHSSASTNKSSAFPG